MLTPVMMTGPATDVNISLPEPQVPTNKKPSLAVCSVVAMGSESPLKMESQKLAFPLHLHAKQSRHLASSK